MKTKTQYYTALLLLMTSSLQISPIIGVEAANTDMIYPLKTISKLDCRFQEYNTLGNDCIQNLPILKSKDYKKYATQNDGYNDYTRIYTVLWGSSYKYGWDVGNGGHQGTDIATAKGTPVYAISDGKIVTAGEEIGWGNVISIEHTLDGKKYISNYAHLSKIDVKKGDTIKGGEKIGEVGSTGNSTGNHLHFQIDLPNKFHPYYYDYTACPYSYYEITENGVCFDELEKNTIDPLVFLETNGAILSQKETTSSQSSSTSSPKTTNSDSSINSIFDTTVYYDYGTEDDVKMVQKVMRTLGYYTGKINGDFEDIEDSIIKYQIDTKIIATKADEGAGWFGPKTRTQAKKDYMIALADEDTPTKVVKNTETRQKTEVISRETLKMTREEIEAREVQEFLNQYNIDFSSSISQISENQVQQTFIEVSNNKGKGFKGNVPGNVSFSYDESKISVFPKSFYNFTDGKREIFITGKSQGHTTLNVKIGDVIVKTFSISVGKTGVARIPSSAKIYSSETAVIGETKKGIILMKDQYGNKLTKAEYTGNFSLNDTGNIEYCIKKGRIEDIKSIYSRECSDDEYSNSLNFSYNDTIEGLLVFQYRAKNIGKYELELKNGNSSFAKQNLAISAPKGLSTKHIYYNDIMLLLESGVADAGKNGYFGEEMSITKKEALNWIKNSSLLKNDLSDEFYEEYNSKTNSLTRKDFAELIAKYSGTSNAQSPPKDYRDLEPGDEVLIASLAGSEYVWKDSFGEKYFQPKSKITRGEAAYFLRKVIDTQGKGELVLK